MKITLMAAGLILMAVACNQRSNISPLLSTSRLPSTIFEIDPAKDTVLHTPQGATISIGAGSFNSRKTVQLEWKEAYSIRDIVAGGLITTSHGQPLSSGGMLYLAPVGKRSVKILKPLIATLPALFIDGAMLHYKGETKNGELLNWEKVAEPGRDSVPVMPSHATVDRLAFGKKLFEDQCITCHSVYKDLAGPQLLTITDRMKVIDPNYPTLLYQWTRNSQAVLASGNEYFNNLFLRWNKTPMNAFPLLTDKELDALYAYIDHEKMNRRIPIPNYSSTCYDSCLQDYKSKETLKHQKQGDSPEAMNAPLQNRNSIPVNNYQLNITSFGWQNVMTESWNGGNSRLAVSVSQVEDNPLSIYLIVPDYKVFLPGAKWKGKGNNYYFQDPSQNLAIPAGQRAIIFAMTEIDGQIWFGVRQIEMQVNQFEELKLQPHTPEEINQQLYSLDSLSGICNCDLYF